MSARLALSAIAAVAASAVVASAATGPGESPTKALRLPTLDRCIRGSDVHATLVPPEGTTFASVSVRVGRRDVLQLSGLSGPGIVAVRLPRRGGTVHVTASTADGRFLTAERTYRRCRPRPSRPQATPAPPQPPRPVPVPLPDRPQAPAPSGGGTGGGGGVT
jgi:hypothetical protein